MDIRALTYFLEVVKHNSFSKASQQLHLSQPTLSKMIKQLEEELGVVLFDRSTRRMQLTETGETLSRHARLVMQALDHLQSALQDIKELRTGQFAFGMPPVIGASFFPRILARFHRQYPGMHIQLVEEGGKQIEQMLLEGKLDLGVVVLPVNEEWFDVTPLVERKLRLVLPAGHRLASMDRIPLSALKEEPFIMFRKGFSLHDKVRAACIEAGFEPRIAYESAQWDFIGEMVAAGMGIAFLPETACEKLDPRQVKTVAGTEPQIDWNIGLIRRRDSYLNHAAREWVRFVQAEFSMA